MDEKNYIKTLKDKIEFYCNCRANSLMKDDKNTGYHFHVMANTTLELLEEFTLEQAKEKEVK